MDHVCAAAGSSAGRPLREVPRPSRLPCHGARSLLGGCGAKVWFATIPNARDRVLGKIPSPWGANSAAWEQVHSFPRLCWERRSIAHTLCFGTWRGTRSCPHPHNWAASPRCSPIKEPRQTAALSLQHRAALKQPSSSPGAAQHGEDSRGGLRPPPPHRALLPEPGSE